VPQTRELIAGAAATAVGGVLITTVWMSSVDSATHDLTSFSERRLPIVVMLPLLAVAAIAPLGVLAWAQDSVVALGLGVAAVAAYLPLWAAWPDPDARWRTLALAVGPLALAWVGAMLAAAAGLVHAVTYDPFHDVGCARVCLHVAAWWEISTERSALLVAFLMALGGALVVARAVRHRGLAALTAGAGAVVLCVLAVVRWRTVGSSDAYAAVLLGAVGVPGLVALPAVAVWSSATRRRSAVRRLARDLAGDPERLLALGRDIDPTLLSPGQQLALRNAELADEAQRRLAEVQASQRRVIAAADSERRRIERDLHDGTQQRLVGVLMQLAGRGLDEVEQEVRNVLADLRSFGEAAFPAVLEEEGLEAALVELAATSDAELRLEVRLPTPVPAEHARAVYALVALADMGTVDVSVSLCNHHLDVAMMGLSGVDLGHLQDRFGALGGRLAVTGERIEGSLPCAW
jgi:signal transduction histidine kinase